MAYPINAPITFVNTNGGSDTINFNADGPAVNLQNKILNMVVTTPGDLLYRSAGISNYLERLSIGTTGQLLGVSAFGLPAWQDVGMGNGSFTAYITNSTSNIPTSRSGGANSGTWFKLYGNTPPGPFVTWSTAFPGSDVDGIFVTTLGANYGLLSIPVSGVYDLNSIITFDSGTGVNAGVGLPPAPLPSGRAIRQARMIVASGPDAGTVLATSSLQVSGFNDNTTAVELSAVSCPLSAGDFIGIEVRHDRSANNTCTIGNPLISTQTQSYFSGYRVK